MASILSLKNVTIEYNKENPILKYFSKLSKYFNRTSKAVKNVSFELEEGKVLGIIGESGSGKSSLAKAIVGLIDISKGEIIYNEKYHIEKLKTQKEWSPIRSDIQMIFQNPSASLDPCMTIYDIIAEPLISSNPNISKKELDEKVSEIMKNTCLHSDFKYKYTTQCSGGQNQRIAIARALIQKPKILLCDEPVSALDLSTQANIMNLLIDLRSKFNLSMIFISHDLSIVNYIADDIIVMNKGEIIEAGKCEEIYKNPKHKYTKLLVDLANY